MKRQGLSREERIKSKKEFEQIYSSGKHIISSGKKIKALFIISENEPAGVQIAIAVSKKTGKAVFRNRVKRIIRAAFRLNKIEFVDYCLKKGKNIKIVFSPVIPADKKLNINLEYFESDIKNILMKIGGNF